MRRGVSLGLFGLWTLVAAGAVSADDDDADEKVSVSDTTMSAPPEAEKAYRKPSYEPLRGFKLLDPVDQPNNAPTSGVACAEDPDGNTSSRAELTFQPCIRLCVTKDSFHRIGANLAERKDE